MLKYVSLLAVLLFVSFAQAEEAPGKVATGSIIGTVVDANGGPIADVAITVYIAPLNTTRKADTLGDRASRKGNKGPQTPMISVANATSDARGTFVVDTVAAGDYIVHAKGKGGTDEKVVTVTDGAKVPVTLTLQGGGGGDTVKKNKKQK